MSYYNRRRVEGKKVDYVMCRRLQMRCSQKEGEEIKFQKAGGSEMKQQSMNDENLSLLDENGTAERELMISCIDRKSSSEDLNVGRQSDAGIYSAQQKSCESLQGAFKDEEKEKNGFIMVDNFFFEEGEFLKLRMNRFSLIMSA